MVCPHCGTEFEPKYVNQTRCSSRCTRRAAEKRRRKRVGTSWNNNNRGRLKKKTSGRQHRNRTFISAYKEFFGCLICGESLPRCLDFHHLDRGEKSFTVSKRTIVSLPRLVSEIWKCVVLCANCHRKVEGDDHIATAACILIERLLSGRELSQNENRC